MCIKNCQKSDTKVSQILSQECHKSVTKVSTIGTKCHIEGQPIKMCDTLFERSTSEIYQSSPYFEIWNKVFDSKSDQSLEHPIGYGPSNGFYIMLHSFEASRYQFHQLYLYSFCARRSQKRKKYS
jgi:hypothetical protein